MRIEEARRVLGNDAVGVSDDILEKEIEVAELFKVIFFDWIKKGKLNIKNSEINP